MVEWNNSNIMQVTDCVLPALRGQPQENAKIRKYLFHILLISETAKTIIQVK